MANNRLYLVYRPTGDYVYLGKRMGWGWYGAPENLGERMNAFFDKAEELATEQLPNGEYHHQDDFALVMEDSAGAPWVLQMDHYPEREDGQLVIKNHSRGRTEPSS